MKPLTVIALVAAGILALAPDAAAAGRKRLGNTAMGAAAGAVVAGPIGAVAGGVIGYSAGRRIARGLGFRDSQPRRVRHHRASQR
jgi:membrane protein YqaA with SNARE-associated domain